jgi:hypothetical protein
MRYLNLAAAALFGMTAMSALAQTPPGMNPLTGARPGHEPGVGYSLPLSKCASSFLATDTRSSIAPTPPSLAISDNVTTNDYLRFARASLVAGRTCQAQQSLEMAETRALDRSVEPGQGSVPDDSLLVSRINDARRALGDGDNPHAIQLVDLALSN